MSGLSEATLTRTCRQDDDSLIETRDRTKLFYKDWGNGKPVVFVHGWALGADMWEYQMP